MRVLLPSAPEVPAARAPLTTTPTRPQAEPAATPPSAIVSAPDPGENDVSRTRFLSGAAPSSAAVPARQALCGGLAATRPDARPVAAGLLEEIAARVKAGEKVAPRTGCSRGLASHALRCL